MHKPNRLPREQATADGQPADLGPVHGDDSGSDVEGHRAPSGDRLSPRLPGTGGDFRRPTSGGELTDDDVEAHGIQDPSSFAPRLPGTGGDLGPRVPGTGGDFRRPSGGGEIAIDVEADDSH